MSAMADHNSSSPGTIVTRVKSESKDACIDFSTEYSQRGDEELLHLATQRHSLTTEAVAALDAELSRRNLTESDRVEHQKFEAAGAAEVPEVGAASFSGSASFLGASCFPHLVQWR